MASHKSSRLAGEIHKEVAGILSQEVRDPRLELVSVLNVEAAPDGCSARIYLSSLNGFQPAEVMKALESAKGFIRKLLGQRLKARVVPELFFFLDSSTEYAIYISQVIDKQIKADESAHKNNSGKIYE
ncbi:MAG: 30S ribosome-binding factor RbfA [Bacillota bacterium]|jgi:ribosome-binding factor A